MWPYASRFSRFMGDPSEISPSTLENEDFSLNEVAIKLWLPQRLVSGIDLLCDHHDATRPDVLRWIFFEHAFGRIEFAHLQRRYAASLKVSDGSTMLFSRRRGPVSYETPTRREINAAMLGKATEDLKLFLPERLKRELDELAQRARQPLSDYLRATLARQLLGERFFQDWQDALAQANAEGRRRESGSGPGG